MKKFTPLFILSILFMTLGSSNLYAKAFKVCTVEILDGMTAVKGIADQRLKLAPWLTFDPKQAYENHYLAQQYTFFYLLNRFDHY